MPYMIISVTFFGINTDTVLSLYYTVSSNYCDIKDHGRSGSI